MTTENLPLYLTCDDIQLVPAYSMVPSRKYVEVPGFIFSAPMDRVTGYEMTSAMIEAGQMPVLSRFISDEEWEKTVKEFGNHPQFWLAVSGKLSELNRTIDRLQELSVTPAGLAVDIAVGHGIVAHSAYELISKRLPNMSIMSGSIATREGARACIEAGCNYLRVGIGPGSMCITRKTTGFGMPQWTTVREIWHEVQEFDDVTIIADGGIRGSDDVAKLLVAGADAVMFGSILSKCIESPGWERVMVGSGLQNGMTFTPGRNQYEFRKVYRGQASADFQRDNNRTCTAPEGASTEIVYQGDTVANTVSQYIEYMTSAVSYAGGISLDDLNPSVKVVRVTRSGQIEASAHGTR